MAKLLVIGAVAAGTSAAAKARRVDPQMEIKVFAEGEYISYGACGLPYFIGGLITTKEKLLHRSVESFAQQRIDVKPSCRATEIDVRQRRVAFTDLVANRQFEEEYDKLVIATGGRPVVADWPGMDKAGIFTLRTISDGAAIKDDLQRRRPQHVLIIGAGYIGLEMTENLTELGCQVTLAERGPHISPNMDADMAAIIQQHLELHGVKVLVNQEVIGFEGGSAVEAAVTRDGTIPADFVLIAIGVRPNSELAAAAGIQLGVNQAIKVNSRMETSATGVYSGGDCATTTNLITGHDVYVPMGTTANKQGRVAGENAAGGNAYFRGILGTGIARVHDLEISRTGLTEEECHAKGLKAISQRVQCRTAALPGLAGDIWVKMTAAADSERIIGAQIVGHSGSGKRIDAIAAAITMEATLRQMYDFDMAYAPPFSPVWDPVLLCLNQFK